MADHVPSLVDEDRHVETEGLDTVSDLLHMTIAVKAWIARIRQELRDRPECDG
jgi:uncharacterized damage-inducible protein DinB